MRTGSVKKYVIPNIPYLFVLWACLKLGTAYRLAAGADFPHKLMGLGQTVGPAFANLAPGLDPFDWLVGIVGAVGFRLLIYFKNKNAKKFRRDEEFGSARWGGPKDIAPFVDPVFENNVILTGTELLTMNTRPKNPANARNLNACVIGSSGSGKTRFWLTPQLLQASAKKKGGCSFVVVDPKGGVLSQVGAFLQRRGYRIKVFNSIDFSQSMHYNPLAYIRNEADILKFVDTLIANTKIARMLTEQQIPTPGTLEYRRTGSTRRYHPGYECKWATNTVVHILENREYTGCLVNFKTEKPSYKTKHSVENPIEKQAIFENHHEPIIDTETWERVQELRKQRKRPNRYDEVGLFSGMLFCADCGHVMYQQRYQNKNRKQDCYICGSYKKRTRDCTAHFIRTDLLTAGVLSNLRQVTEYAARHESRFVKLLIQQNEIGGKRKTAAATKQLEQAQERIAEVSRIIKRLYEDNVNGKISDERFMELSADYEQEQRELKDRTAALQAELDKSQAATVNAEKFMGIVRKHLAFEELTPTLLREMIEKIVVHECSYDENGTRRQDIEIYYSFVGKIDLPEA